MAKPVQVSPLVMDCIVVGGAANGVLLRRVDAAAQRIELSRPDYVKPLTSARQTAPEVARLKDVYNVHPISLRNDDGRTALFGIAVVDGQTLTWGFSELVKGFIENVTTEITRASKNKH